MPRYVVLYHETALPQERPSHWDFMLEEHGVLRTWAIQSPPSLSEEQPAEALPDHRLTYLDYEGPLSENRGQVTRVMAGEYEKLVDQWPDKLVVQLSDGERSIIVHLNRIGSSTLWTARFEAG